jgi:hypothetical protein
LMKSTSYSQVEWVDDTDEDDFIEVWYITMVLTTVNTISYNLIQEMAKWHCGMTRLNNTKQSATTL